MFSWKTIITYLVDGDPLWIKTIELSNWVWKGIIIPRSKLKLVKDRPEVKQPAVYFLFWEDENGNKKAYIWETEKLIDRIFAHDIKKDRRNVVIAFISKDNNLTKSDIKFLEYMSIKKAKEVGRFQLENKSIPEKNVLPEYKESEMMEFLENINLLISTAWYPIFKPLYQWQTDEENIFYLTARWADAKWTYTEEGFVVFKWSKWPAEPVKSFKKYVSSSFKLREKLLQQWILRIEKDYIILTKDYKFSSPSTAADVIIWRSSNWWKDWKNKYWKSLDEIYRRDNN